MSSAAPSYKPSLEGIRALAFLLVFTVHFSGPTWTLQDKPLLSYPWFLLCQLSFCAVPIFFALSGYLITAVLLRSKGKEGFFRVFYLRRALRVLPLFYVTLLGVYAAAHLMGSSFQRRHLLLLTYLFNYWPHDGFYNINRFIHIGHFWSLAVEEQFYLLWPVAIFLIRDHRKLLHFCYGVVVVSFVARLTWPLWHIASPEFVYQNTLFRCDALMLGAVLTLKEQTNPDFFARIATPARIALAASSVIIVFRALQTGEAMPFDNFGVMVVMPLLSLMGASIVVLALAPGTWIASASSWRWTVYLGKRSYALYVFHQLFVPFFLDRAIPHLARTWDPLLAQLGGMLTAFALTMFLAEIAYRLVEQPAMLLKQHVNYGRSQKAVSQPTLLRNDQPVLLS